ncbi:flagellar hook-basal body complex protein FliE [Rhodobacteraceae bacterium RKSG542]|uniref:flagellar hook-basal body complex protein FliE n=1 Tax=Pseudovibrio flavus TaxID=2529854 RepID=UPI0012BB4C63|nr:flagellar hook-basal body complex protein FliE [Pseudovibrio flavus]MTI19283.1 flagellar hook-basal body complex protein FliE [Pseudovibrio flavus]
MSNATMAANAYASMAQVGSATQGGVGATAGGLAKGEGSDFAQMVQSAVQDVADAGSTTESQSIDLLQGNANVVDVVTAVAETELALETMVSVRDRVISAYEEIMRMPI